jgi:hypothetical protein
VFKCAKCQWLTPQEVEIRKIMFPRQPGQIVCETLLKKPTAKKGSCLKKKKKKEGLVEWFKV